MCVTSLNFSAVFWFANATFKGEIGRVEGTECKVEGSGLSMTVPKGAKEAAVSREDFIV